jgi:hypothetical protein
LFDGFSLVPIRAVAHSMVSVHGQQDGLAM